MYVCMYVCMLQPPLERGVGFQHRRRIEGPPIACVKKATYSATVLICAKTSFAVSLGCVISEFKKCDTQVPLLGEYPSNDSRTVFLLPYHDAVTCVFEPRFACLGLQRADPNPLPVTSISGR